jgi:hypothetical protein
VETSLPRAPAIKSTAVHTISYHISVDRLWRLPWIPTHFSICTKSLPHANMYSHDVADIDMLHTVAARGALSGTTACCHARLRRRRNVVESSSACRAAHRQHRDGQHDETLASSGDSTPHHTDPVCDDRHSEVTRMDAATREWQQLKQRQSHAHSTDTNGSAGSSTRTPATTMCTAVAHTPAQRGARFTAPEERDVCSARALRTHLRGNCACTHHHCSSTVMEPTLSSTPPSTAVDAHGRTTERHDTGLALQMTRLSMPR